MYIYEEKKPPQLCDVSTTRVHQYEQDSIPVSHMVQYMITY